MLQEADSENSGDREKASSLHRADIQFIWCIWVAIVKWKQNVNIMYELYSKLKCRDSISNVASSA